MPAFPLSDILRAAYGNVLGDHNRLLHAAGAWLLVVMAISAATRYLAVSGIVTPLNALSLGLIANFVWVLGLNAIAVFWERQLLLGDQTLGLAAPLAPRVFRFLGVSVLVGLAGLMVWLICLFVVLLFTGVPNAHLADLIGPRLAVVLISSCVAIVLTRLYPLLVAAAIDDRSMTLARAWKLTAGYTLPLFCGLAASIAPFMAAGALLWLAMDRLVQENSLTGFALGMILDFLQTTVVMAFLALSYRFVSNRAGVRAG